MDMNDGNDEWLARLLAQTPPPGDDGFTDRVLARVPSRTRVFFGRLFIHGIAFATGLVACALSPGFRKETPADLLSVAESSRDYLAELPAKLPALLEAGTLTVAVLAAVAVLVLATLVRAEAE